MTGSYHNFAFSQQLPSAIKEQNPNQADQSNNQQQSAANHKEEDCPNSEIVKKLKGEVKRLRQELIMNPKKR